MQHTHQPSHSRPLARSSASTATDAETAHSSPNQHSLNPCKSQVPLTLMQARLSRGWTQQQLAGLIGATSQTVSRWERGVAMPGLYHRNKLCALFGLSLAELGCSLEASTENEADTTGGNEAGQAPGESNTGIGSETGQVFVGEPEPGPPQAPLPLSAPVGLREAGKHVNAQATVTLSPTRPAQHRRRALLWRIVASSCAAILLTSVFALIALHWFWAASFSSTADQRANSLPASIGRGTIAFLSSGDVQGNSAQGMNDEVAIHLADVPVPTPGMGYFLWMTGGASSEVVWTLLGRLTWTPTTVPDSTAHVGKNPDIGTATLFFVSPQHANLLVTFNRFLITAEATNIPPQQPSSVWLYEARISATPTPGDPHHYSLLDHLRHLLAADPSLAALGIRGGLVYWLTRNTQQVALEASHLEMDWYAHRFSELRQHLLCILDYLDGNTLVKADLPPHTPRFLPSPFARVGLRTLSADQEPPGYVLHTDIHLQGIREALGATASQRQLASQLRIAMNAVGFWLTNVRQDALQFIRMDDRQMAQPAALPLLRDLAAQTQETYSGSPLDQSSQAIATPASNQTLVGARWIEGESQHLAIFDWYAV